MNTGLQVNEELRQAVIRELARHFDVIEPDAVRFLAAGEYTLNYRVTTASRDVVLRIVTGSQMGLEPGPQVRYEAHALEVLEETLQVPRLVGVEDAPTALPYPYLLIEFLPGRPLDYRRDLERAGSCVARVHRAGVPAHHGLQDHRDSVRSIFDEVGWLIADAPGVSDEMRHCWNDVEQLAGRVRSTPPAEFHAVADDAAVINTDLNSHNFIINDERVWLIDWEKARIGPTVLDLAHFLLPTTTLWRDAGAARLSRADEDRFVDAYLAQRAIRDRAAYRRVLESMKKLATLRAIAWCAWALAHSELGTRAIENEETLAKCRLFTSPEFIDQRIVDLWG